MKIKWNIEITFSKIMALLILLGGLTAAIWLKDSSIIITALPISGLVIGSKQINDQIKQK